VALGASGEMPAYKSETLEAKGTTAYTVTMIAMLLMSLFIGAQRSACRLWTSVSAA
jgi:hypothetical protein